MKHLTLVLFVFFMSSLLYSQSDLPEEDRKYKEDQFYIGITYNLIGNKPGGLSQTGFSTGVHFGFIKDMPFNSRRNFGLGIGLGGSINSFNQNLQITKGPDDTFNYSILNDDFTSFTLNRFYMSLIEVPLELRWRTSTASDYKFWRIYTGVKLGYLVSNVTKYEGEPGDLRLSQVDDFNDFQYGLSFSAGYNTWNFYLYYGLNPLFNNKATMDGKAIDINSIKIGLLFYIL